jgi:predicted RNA-binding protein YlxR (DUF448 family)
MVARYPTRTCICCRAEGHKGELLRFVWRGEIVFDSSQKLRGRGAYVHKRRSCWRKMAEARRWRSAFASKIGKAGGEDVFKVLKVNMDRVMEEVRTLILD